LAQNFARLSLSLFFEIVSLDLLSMTGHGEGRCNAPSGGQICAEIRTVNNRHFKLSLRTGDGIGNFESQIESLVREQVRRGSVQLNLFWHGQPAVDLYRIQYPVVQSYLRQCEELAVRTGLNSTVDVNTLLNLPGVLAQADSSGNSDNEQLESVVLSAVQSSLDELGQMRSREGQSMAKELLRQLSQLEQFAESIEQRSPEVLIEYRQRLKSRVMAAIAEAVGGGESHVCLDDADLIREVALMADRADIREEIVRLRSHFQQFNDLLHSDGPGRKLDFLVQEMFREANTIGAKAGDAMIAQRVVDIKACLEQIRELVQNVE
jgi:uncharacterized protein (TIGR00255 family)